MYKSNWRTASQRGCAVPSSIIAAVTFSPVNFDTKLAFPAFVPSKPTMGGSNQYTPASAVQWSGLNDVGPDQSMINFIGKAERP